MILVDRIVGSDSFSIVIYFTNISEMRRVNRKLGILQYLASFHEIIDIFIEYELYSMPLKVLIEYNNPFFNQKFVSVQTYVSAFYTCTCRYDIYNVSMNKHPYSLICHFSVITFWKY